MLLIATVLCCLLSACSELTYSVQIATGGARTLTVSVHYAEDATEEEINTINEFLRQVADSRVAGGRPCRIDKGEGYVTLKEEFDSATEYYISMGYTGDEPNDEETPYVNLNAYFMEYVTEMPLATRATVVGYQWQFAVKDASAKGIDLPLLWRYYCSGRSASLFPLYGRLAASEDIVTDTLDALSGEYGEALCEVLSVWLGEKGYALSDVPFRYTYEHVYKSVYAETYTNSYKNKETGATVYEWNMTAADIADTTVTLHQKVPRVWAWELTSVAAGVAVMGVILVIILIKRRKISNASEENG